MDPESKKLLEDTLELAKENNNMLHSMRRSLRIQRAMGLVYWIFIIGSAVGAYYFVEPYLAQIKDVYNGANDVINSFNQ